MIAHTLAILTPLIITISQNKKAPEPYNPEALFEVNLKNPAIKGTYQ